MQFEQSDRNNIETCWLEGRLNSGCSNHVRYDKLHMHNSSGKQSSIFQLDATGAAPQTFNKYRRQAGYEYSSAEMSRHCGAHHRAYSALTQCCHFTILHSVMSNFTFRTMESAITDIIFILLTFFHFAVSCFPCFLQFLIPQLLNNRLNFFTPIFFPENPTFRFSHNFLFIFCYLKLLTCI
jgi:hypothetical protein